MHRTDTICAPATAAGKAGICIIRISGPESHEILSEIFRPLNGAEILPRMLVLGDIHDGDMIIDRVLAVKFVSPNSFTGEDVAEIHAHGGDMVARLIMNAAIKAGCVIAEPGEFSKRAFLNGKMDVSQAESIQDLIGSISEKSAEISARNMRGEIFGKIRDYQDRLKDILAGMQAGIEYPEENLEAEISERELPALRAVLAGTEKLIDSYDTGKAVRDGVPVAIVGNTNVGKSSLLNALLGQERAIVTDIPGTTRDVLSDTLNISGVPVILYDTAGLRDTDDEVEKIGVKRALNTADDASFSLFVFDASRKVTEEEKKLYASVSEKKPAFPVLNKTDLETVTDEKDIEAVTGLKPVKISAKNGEGLEALLKLIYDKSVPDFSLLDGVVITNARHKSALVQASRSLRDALDALENGISLDCVTIDIQSAWELLGEITGETLNEEIIDRIFENFCLGK